MTDPFARGLDGAYPATTTADDHGCGCGATFESEAALEAHAREVHHADG